MKRNKACGRSCIAEGGGEGPDPGAGAHSRWITGPDFAPLESWNPSWNIITGKALITMTSMYTQGTSGRHRKSWSPSYGIISVTPFSVSDVL